MGSLTMRGDVPHGRNQQVVGKIGHRVKGLGVVQAPRLLSGSLKAAVSLAFEMGGTTTT